MIKINDFSVFVKDKKVIDTVNVEFEKGFYSLTGQNGSGKTSFALGLAGHFNYKTTGSCLLYNQSITNLPVSERIKAGLFVSLQKPVPLSGVSVLNFLKSTVKLEPNELIKKIKDVLPILGFTFNDLKKQINLDFSGGEAKKLEFIQMYLHNPKFIILDEIDAGLDKQTKINIRDFIQEKMVDQTVIIISHQEDFISGFQNKKQLSLNQGKIYEH